MSMQYIVHHQRIAENGFTFEVYAHRIITNQEAKQQVCSHIRNHKMNKKHKNMLHKLYAEIW